MLNPLELALQKVVRHQWMLGTEPWDPGRAANTAKHGAIFPGPRHDFLLLQFAPSTSTSFVWLPHSESLCYKGGLFLKGRIQARDMHNLNQSLFCKGKQSKHPRRDLRESPKARNSSVSTVMLIEKKKFINMYELGGFHSELCDPPLCPDQGGPGLPFRTFLLMIPTKGRRCRNHSA